MSYITQARLQQLFNYDSSTGQLTFRVPRGGKRAGDRAGWYTRQGKHKLFVEGQAYDVGYLVQVYTLGEWEMAKRTAHARNNANKPSP